MRKLSSLGGDGDMQGDAVGERRCGVNRGVHAGVGGVRDSAGAHPVRVSLDTSRSDGRTEDTMQHQTASSDQLAHQGPAQLPPPPTPEQRHQTSAPDSTAHS
jgi:hypothetical protein